MKEVMIATLAVGSRFKTDIGTFIVLEQLEGATKVITEDLFKENVVFDDNTPDYKLAAVRNLFDSDILTEFARVFGADNIIEHEVGFGIGTQVGTLDGSHGDISGITVDINDASSLLYRVEASRDGENYVSVMQHMGSAMTGIVNDEFDAVRARYMRIWIYRATDSDGKYVNAAINEVSLKVKEDSPLNVAPLAHISVTSIYPGIDARVITD